MSTKQRSHRRWTIFGCAWKALLLLAAVAALVLPTARGADVSARTQQLVAVLKSEASFYEKARACQQLGEIGTPDAVPVLAGLLSDTKLSAYARSGLEGIPDPSAAAALRAAAQNLKGSLLAGVINSLGVLRDTQATPMLIKLAAEPSSGVAKEALLALGNIATPDSIEPIEKALTGGPDSTRTDAAAALLIAADRQRTHGDLKRAAALFDLIRAAKVPAAYHVAATRGAILARTTDRASFLVEQLRSSEPAIRDAALLTIREIPDDSLAQALNKEVAQAAPELQVQVILAIADCHNADSIAVMEGLTSNSDPEIRRRALSVLGRLGPTAAPALLTALHTERPAEERTIVLAGLKGMQGSSVDDLLIRALDSANTSETRVELIRLLDSRGVSRAAPGILKLCTPADMAVAAAGLSAMSSLAGPGELPSLIEMARSANDPAIRDGAESALVGICSRSGEAASQAILAELKQATTATERNCWIRVLARVGFPKALPIIEAAAGDSDSAVAENAIVQLGHWPDPAPMEALLNAIEAGAKPGLRQHALAAVLDLATTAADERQVPEMKIVAWVQRAGPVAQSVEEKKKMLGLLARLNTSESLHLLSPYLEDSNLRTEAASAIVQIAPALAKGADAADLKTSLDKVAFTVANGDLRERARQLAKTITVSGPPVTLFDGRSLAGWEGDTNVWRVREGLIVGGFLTGNPRNEFLATTRSYTNFAIRLDYKLVGSEGFVNSGVQFRSVRMTNPPNEMNGYQADIGAGYSGCLYDESRRNTFLARAGQESIQRLEKTNDWNHYEVRCEGNHIQLWLNGEKTVDYTETDATLPQRGLIGLQIHGGNKAEVSFRNIVIQEF